MNETFLPTIEKWSSWHNEVADAIEAREKYLDYHLFHRG